MAGLGRDNRLVWAWVFFSALALCHTPSREPLLRAIVLLSVIVVLAAVVLTSLNPWALALLSAAPVVARLRS